MFLFMKVEHKIAINSRFFLLDNTSLKFEIIETVTGVYSQTEKKRIVKHLCKCLVNNNTYFKNI